MRSPTPDGKNGGTRAPRGKGRTARGQRAAVGPSAGQGARSLCLSSARYLQSGLSPSSVGTVRSAPSPPPSRLDGHTVPRGPGRTGPRVRRDQDLGARRGVLKDRRKMLFRAVRDHPAIIKKKQNKTSCHLLQSGCARLRTKPQVPRDKQEPEPGGPTTEINTPRFRWGGADKPHANRMWCLTQLEKAEESRRRLPLRTGLDGAEEQPVTLFFFYFRGAA